LLAPSAARLLDESWCLFEVGGLFVDYADFGWIHANDLHSVQLVLSCEVLICTSSSKLLDN
jgi:hypothetical protein